MMSDMTPQEGGKGDLGDRSQNFVRPDQNQWRVGVFSFCVRDSARKRLLYSLTH